MFVNSRHYIPRKIAHNGKHNKKHTSSRNFLTVFAQCECDVVEPSTPMHCVRGVVIEVIGKFTMPVLVRNFIRRFAVFIFVVSIRAGVQQSVNNSAMAISRRFVKGGVAIFVMMTGIRPCTQQSINDSAVTIGCRLMKSGVAVFICSVNIRPRFNQVHYLIRIVRRRRIDEIVGVDGKSQPAQGENEKKCDLFEQIHW